MTSIFEKLHLVESDAPPQPAPAAAFAPTPPPIPQTPSLLADTGGSSALSPDDTAAKQSIEATLYAKPSAYTIFRQFRLALGDTSDMAKVFQLLAAANPDVTAARVKADIDAHLAMIDQRRTDFEAEASRARQSGIDGPAAEITSLTAEIAAKTQRLTTLQDGVRKTQAAIEAGRQQFARVEHELRQPLEQAKQLLTAIN